MEAFGQIVAAVVVALLWVAAVAFGTDSRAGSDWLSRGSLQDRPPRLGD